MNFKVLLKEANKADANGDIFTEECLKTRLLIIKIYFFEHGKLFYTDQFSKNNKISMEKKGV